MLSGHAPPSMAPVTRMTVLSNALVSSVRRHNVSRYATLTHMQRPADAPSITRSSLGLASPWITRRWYYTPKSHRAYSVRQISPGDRRLLAEFALGLSREAPVREVPAARAMTSMLFDRVIIAGVHDAVGYAAL